MKQSKQFSHYILTRFNFGLYDKEDADEWMSARMGLFEATKESILSQEGEFQWIVSVDSRTPVKYLKKIFTDKRMIKVTCDSRVAFDDIKPKTPWVITTRMDNDDLYLPGAVKAIQEQFKPEIRVIDIEYNQLYKGKRYTSERRGPNSPFLSLVEPSDRVKTCYCRPHYKLLDGYPTEDGLVSIPGKKTRVVYAYMVIHKSNMANKLVGKEVK